MTLSEIRSDYHPTNEFAPMRPGNPTIDTADYVTMTVKRQAQMPDGTRTAYEAICVVADRLKAYAHQYEAQQDIRAVFAFAYAEITEAIAQSATKNDFQDPVWVARLDAVFAQYYFNALEAFDNQMPVSAAWTQVFALICSPTASRKAWAQPSILEALVISLITHIVCDLPCALADVMVDDGHKPEHMADFNKINEILGAQIESIQDKISDRYDPSLKWFDRWLGNAYDEILTGYTVKLSRGLAWFNALRLRVTNQESEDRTLRASILDTANKGIELISRPANCWLRIGLWLYRLCSHFYRRWPNKAISYRDWTMA